MNINGKRPEQKELNNRYPGARYFIQFWETTKVNGLRATIGEIFYFNRELIVAEKDLESIKLKEDPPKSKEKVGIEINRDNFSKLGLNYGLRGRYYKALANTRKGYASFAIVKGTRVVADIWYADGIRLANTHDHPDLSWLNLSLRPKDVYLWDVYADVEERKSLVAINLFALTLRELRRKGYERAYGFIFCDNKPSMGLIKLLGFKEVKRLRAHRFFFWRKAYETTISTPSR